MVLFCLTLTHSCFLRECSRVVREVMYSDAQQRQSLAALSLSLSLQVPGDALCPICAGLQCWGRRRLPARRVQRSPARLCCLCCLSESLMELPLL